MFERVSKDEVMRLEARIKSLCERVDFLEKQMNSLHENLNEVKTNLDEASTAKEIMDEWLNGKDGNE